MQLKRRTLLSGLAASAAVPFMSAAHAKQADADTKWDKEYEGSSLWSCFPYLRKLSSKGRNGNRILALFVRPKISNDLFV